MRTLAATAIAALIAFGTASADIIKNGSLQAFSDGANVTLQWITQDEANVLRFEIERRMSTDAEFLPVGTIDAKGSSLYEFVDYSAFQKITSMYQYRIKIVFKNGQNPLYTDPLTVLHTVSGVRRTWGSIKAMFR